MKRRCVQSLLSIVIALLLTPIQLPAQTEATGGAKFYELQYSARVVPTERVAHVEIRLGAGASRVRSIRLAIDPQRHFDFKGDGAIEADEEGRILWEPPGKGGVLRYTFRIDHLRDSASYDARCAENWALFRGDDLVPPARVIAETGAHARAHLRLRGPDGWSVVAPYDRLPDDTFSIDNPDRRFDRPTGWFAMGKLGVLRERIAGSRVAIAGPAGQDLRRHDMLALLRWTLPVLRDVVGELPDRIVVVSAGDPMWRGGLSGPRSVYVHADRPLISTDLTSPILHELVHSVLGGSAGPGGDWIVEGIAELYSLELLVRSKTVSRRRFEKALTRLAERGREVEILEVDRADGDVTARAVTVLRALDARLRSSTEGTRGLDDVAAQLAASRSPITTESFRGLVEQLAGQDFDDFFRSEIPRSHVASRARR